MKHVGDFSEALRLLKAGHRVARAGWNGKSMWLQLVRDEPAPPGSPFQRRAFIEMKDASDCLVPWVPSQTDLIAVDWEANGAAADDRIACLLCTALREPDSKFCERHAAGFPYARGLPQTMIRERFRAWLHRDCRRERGVADALLEIGGRLGELGRYCHELTKAVVERPERVTVIVFGLRAGADLGAEAAGVEVLNLREWFVVDSKSVRVGQKSERIDCTSYFPIQSFQVLVLANLERVEILGVFKGRDLLAMASPVAYGTDWHLGVNVSVLCSLREAGG